MSERPDEEWIRRIELYLELGSDGVVVLVDRARDALIGDLVRALVRKHPDLAIVVSPEELREVPAGSVVLYHAEPEDAERLNLIRPVLKDRGLRVVLWAQGTLGSELPLRAPDLYDWISHRVECPQHGAPRFVRLSLLAASAVERPVLFKGSFDELRASVQDAWPGIPLVRVDDADYDALVVALGAKDSFVVIERQPSHEIIRARWAMAEAHRRTKVALLGYGADLFELDNGFWRLSSQQSALRRQPIESRIGAAVVDLEPQAIEWMRQLRDGAAREWWTGALDDPDPAVALARHIKTSSPSAAPWAHIADGWAPPPALRAWGGDPRVLSALQTAVQSPLSLGAPWFAAALAAPTLVRTLTEPTARVPAPVLVEVALWEDAPDWRQLGDKAAEAGQHDIAIRWDLRSESPTRAVQKHVEAALAGASTEERFRILRLAAAAMEGRPSWFDSLEARVLCDQSDFATLIKLSRPQDPATEAYLDTFRGGWRSALTALHGAQEAEELGEYRKAGIAFAAWACDAAGVARPMLVPDAAASQSTPRLVWWRWLPALALARVDEHRWSFGASEDPSRDWAFAFREQAPAEAAVCWLAASAHAERLLDHRAVVIYAAHGVAELEEAFAPREHVLEGVLLLLQGRALARLGQPDRAIDKLTMSESIVRRTTDNERHPWALMARFERDWLRARHRGGSVESVDVALDQLREALWPEHRDLREAEKLRARL